MLDIHDRYSLFPARHVCIRAGHIQVARIFQRDRCAHNRFRLGKVGDIQNLQTVAIHHKRIAELHGHASWVIQKRRPDFSSHFWL